MAGDKARLTDARLDLQAIQSRALAAVREYGQYLRDAENAGVPEIAYFVRQLLQEDSARAVHCDGLLQELSAAREVPAKR